MIVITKKIQVNGLDLPFKYTWKSNNACILSMSATTGTLENLTNGVAVLENEVTFQDVACLNDVIANGGVTVCLEKEGCPVTELPVSFTDVCLDFVVNLNQVGDTFYVTATGGSGNFSYSWFFDTNVFNRVDDMTNPAQIELQLKASTPPGADYTVGVVVTDNTFGCTARPTILYVPCVIQANDVVIVTDCNVNPTNNGVFDTLFNLNVVQCLEEIDWASANFFASTAPSINVVHIGTNNFRLEVPNTLPAGNQTIQYTVNDVNGQPSTVGMLNIVVTQCAAAPIVTANAAMNAMCFAQTNLDLATLIQSPYDNLQIITNGLYGTALINGTLLQYTSTANLFNTPDTIVVEVSNAGLTSNITVTVNREQLIITNITVGACGPGGEQVTVDYSYITFGARTVTLDIGGVQVSEMVNGVGTSTLVIPNLPCTGMNKLASLRYSPSCQVLQNFVSGMPVAAACSFSALNTGFSNVDCNIFSANLDLSGTINNIGGGFVRVIEELTGLIVGEVYWGGLGPVCSLDGNFPAGTTANFNCSFPLNLTLFQATLDLRIESSFDTNCVQTIVGLTNPCI